jgi:hypothetical protein
VDTHLFRQVQPKGGSGKLGPFDFAMSIGALPRPALFGIVGVVLVAGLFFMTHKSSTTTSSPATPAPATSSPATTPGSSAQTGQPSNGAPADRPTTGPAGKGLPLRVKRALDAHKVVAILFWNRHGVDDRSVKASLDSLPHSSRVATFSDRVKNISRYTRITAAANVSTTPSLVIVNRNGQAEVVSGYIDRETLEQYIRNAKRR